MGECRLVMVHSKLVRRRRGEVEVAGPDGCNVRWAPALSVMGSAQLSRLHDVNVGMAGSDGRFVRSVPALSVTGTTAARLDAG